jgi:hypothetical protein
MLLEMATHDVIMGGALDLPPMNTMYKGWLAKVGSYTSLTLIF